MSEFFRRVKQTINPHNHWRSTEYERADGSKFFVGIPASHDEHTGVMAYNEFTEMRTALRLNSRHRQPSEDERADYEQQEREEKRCPHGRLWPNLCPDCGHERFWGAGRSPRA